MKRLKIVTGHAKGSSGSRLSMRSKIQSMNYMYGCPAIFLTLNPCDIHSQLSMAIAGQQFDPITLHDFPIRADRERILASDPVACAKFCHFIFQNMIQYLLGFFPEDHAFYNKGLGVFGKPLAYAGTVEEQGRKALHLHLLLWLDGFNIEKVQFRLQSDIEFKERLIMYLNETISEYCEGVFFNDPTETSRFVSSSPKCGNSHVDLDNQHCVYPKMRTCVEYISHDCDDRHDLDKEKFSSCSLSSFNPDNQDYENLNNYDIQSLVVESQIHVHNKTCTKHQKSHCRMRFGRKIEPITRIDNEGNIHLKRTHPYMNAYNKTLLSLLRCNMDVKFIASASYAKTLNFYITNYITKLNMPYTTMYELCASAVDKLNEKDNHELNPHEASKRLVLACFSKMKTCEEMGAPMAALLQLGLPDFHCSEDFTMLQFSHFYYYLSPNFSNHDSNIDELLDDIELTESSAIRVNQLSDYLYRHESLSHLSVLQFYRNYYKFSLRAPESDSHLSFMSNHPQSQTHAIKKRTHPVIPQFIGKALPSYKNENEFGYAMLLLIYPYSITFPLNLPLDMTWKQWLQNYLVHELTPESHIQFVKNVILYQKGSDSDPPQSDKGDLLTKDFEDITLDNSVMETIDPMEYIDSDDYLQFFDKCTEIAPVCIHPSLLPITPLSSMWSFVNASQVIQSQLSYSIRPNVTVTQTENTTPIITEPSVQLRDMTDSIIQLKQFLSHLGLVGRQRLVVSSFLLFCISMNVTTNSSATNVVGVVLGEGGTGKSQVIKSISSYFKFINQPNAIRLTCPTGVGAANILGVTIHSLLSLMSKNPNYNALSEKLDGVNVLIIDEFSFLGLDTLHQIDSTLRKLWPTNHHRHSMAFGGYHILFIGDFMQLPPVLSYSIYTSTDKIDKLKKSSKKTDYLNGIHSWRAINFAMVLRKNYRIYDLDYQHILTAIRTETFTNEHYELLKSRFNISNSDVPSNVSYLCRTNESRAIINDQYISSLSVHSQCIKMFAQDVQLFRRKRISLLPAEQFHLRTLPDSPSLYCGCLKLLPGVQVMILENIYPDLFIMNGSIGIVIATSSQPPIDSLDNAYVIVQFEWLVESNVSFHEHLPIGCVVFQPTKCKFQYNGKHYERTQFPMCLAKSLSVHKSQGKTLKEGALLCYDNQMSLPMLYVALSRVRSLDHLFVNGTIPREAFQKSWPKDLKCQLLSLLELQQTTLANALHYFPSLNDTDSQILLHELEMDKLELSMLLK